ncbi:MAG: hypothetical protein ACK559_02805, partial [bacterium]
MAGHSSGRRRVTPLSHLWSPSDGAAGLPHSNCFNCSATTPVSYPASLRNFPNGCKGHPRFYPPPDRPPI